MEPVSSIVGTIFKVLQEIAKVERTVRRNRTRCRDLAWRAEVVGNILRDSMAGARGDAVATRRGILCRLKEALNDALKLVESCRQSVGLFSSLSRLLTSGAKAARFDDVNKNITNCLVDLTAANGTCIENKVNQLAAGDHPRTKKSRKEINAGNARQKDAAKNDNNRGWNKGGQNGGKARAAAARPPPQPDHPRKKKSRKEINAGNARQKDAAKNDNNGGWNKGGQNGGKARAAAAAATPPPPLAHAGVPCYPNGHGYTFYDLYIEEDPISCSVM